MSERKNTILNENELISVIGGSSQLETLLTFPVSNKLIEAKKKIEVPRPGINYPGPYKVYM